MLSIERAFTWLSMWLGKRRGALRSISDVEVSSGSWARSEGTLEELETRRETARKLPTPKPGIVPLRLISLTTGTF